ncbi:zinc finger protein 235-like [Culicoides brevitarsis]|uniref:zinc finger protein 235-like n=1 Tax=Culicoides brevitarsis TaxID=469753 RepID=UPI00307B82EA
MAQDINIILNLGKERLENPKFELITQENSKNHKIIADFNANCEKCEHKIQINIFYNDEEVLKIKNHSDLPINLPEISNPVPPNVELPSLTSVEGPYFQVFPQSDGSEVFIEKKSKSFRVTNYDPRSKICDLCNYEVPNADKMSVHRRFHFFPKPNDVECRACGTACSNSLEKTQHSYFCAQSQALEGLSCFECNFKATNFDDFRDHLSKIHSGYPPISKNCKLCGVKTSNNKHKCLAGFQKYLAQLDLPPNLVIPDVYSLKSSYSRTHPQPDGSLVYIGKRDNGIQIMNFDPTTEKCELCGKSHLKNKENVVQHRLKMHFFPPDSGNLCQGCQKEFKTDENKKIHSHFCTKKHLIKVNYCISCREQFTNYPNFASHLKKFHDGAGIECRFMCHLCSKSFEHDHQLQEHVLRHFDGKPFKCAHCDSEQRNKKGIITHLIRFHFNSAAKFKCDSCSPPMLFAYEKQFKVHVDALHLRLQKVSVPCPTCGKLIRKKGLKNHIQKQHTDTFVPKETFECQTCGKIFFRKQNLEAHQLMHLPENERLYKCRFCERTFNKKLGFVEHERNHTGEKPYKCEHCGKAFARSSTFQDHKREHTGQRFVCSVCSKEYKDRGNYRHHMKQHESQMGVKLTFNHEERRLMKLKVLTAEQALKSGI